MTQNSSRDLLDVIDDLRPTGLRVLREIAEPAPPGGTNGHWNPKLLLSVLKEPLGLVRGSLRTMEESGASEVIGDSIDEGEEWRPPC